MVTHYTRMECGSEKRGYLVQSLPFDSSHGAHERFGVTEVEANALVNKWNREAVQFAIDTNLPGPRVVYYIR